MLSFWYTFWSWKEVDLQFFHEWHYAKRSFTSICTMCMKYLSSNVVWGSAQTYFWTVSQGKGGLEGIPSKCLETDCEQKWRQAETFRPGFRKIDILLDKDVFHRSSGKQWRASLDFNKKSSHGRMAWLNRNFYKLRRRFTMRDWDTHNRCSLPSHGVRLLSLNWAQWKGAPAWYVS